jgi:hypothetical protein
MNKLTTIQQKTNVLQLACILLKGTTLLWETHGNVDFDLKGSKKIEIQNK